MCIFDKDYAKSLGYSTKFIDNILLIMMILLICVGLKTVGAILISSFLIILCICASLLSKNLKTVLFISSLVGVLSSFIGTYISSVIDRMSIGPTIIVLMCIFTILSMIFGRYGVIFGNLRRVKK